MEAQYPEHVKLQQVKEQSQVIGEFIENLGHLGLVLCDKDGDGFGRLMPTGRNIQDILAQHFDIDLKKIDAEKAQMLENLRRGNAQEREWND